MTTFFAIILSLIFIYRQVRYQRYANMLSTLACLDVRWKSAEMINARQHVCKDYKSDEKSISQPEELLLAFFEEVGVYLRRRVLDVSVVWEFYSYYVEHYWVILQPRIREFRTDSQDKSWYSEFEFLAKRLAQHSKKRRASVVEKTEEHIKKFILGEITKTPTS
jgi:hypothetical protein